MVLVAELKNCGYMRKFVCMSMGEKTQVDIPAGIKAFSPVTVMLIAISNLFKSIP